MEVLVEDLDEVVDGLQVKKVVVSYVDTNAKVEARVLILYVIAFPPKVSLGTPHLNIMPSQCYCHAAQPK